jgi:DNA-binding transcriptional LysR family regulator
VSPVVRALGSRLKPVYENSLSESLKAMALKHCGVAWLPRTTMTAELERGELACVGDEKLAIPVRIAAYRLRSSTAGVPDAFWELL